MNYLLSPQAEADISARYPETAALLKTLCQIPAPSNHEEQRAEWIKKWLDNLGAEGVYIDSALNVVYPFNCKNRDDIIVFMAHTDTVFPDLTPMEPVMAEGKIHCPGVGDDTANLALMLLIIRRLLE